MLLNTQAAERMSNGEPPGCWISPGLPAKVQNESLARDADEAARLEHAALVSVSKWFDQYPRPTRTPARAEFAVKSPIFGCAACADCEDGLKLLNIHIPPPERSLQGRSSWINGCLDEDARPGRFTVEGTPVRPSPPRPHEFVEVASGQEAEGNQ